ncbi:MAG: rod-binding protein [Gemmatimonadota bacterium]
MKAAPVSPAGLDQQDRRLRQVTSQLEGVFIEQLFKSMRETIPEGGVVDESAGEEIFTGMFDQQLALELPGQLKSALSDALYAQLFRSLPKQGNGGEPR